MDFENFFYIILAVIYFLSRVFKQKKRPTDAPTEETESGAPQKTVTFEDLLKEFTEEKQERKYVEEDEIEEVEEVVENPRRYEQKEVKRTYESKYSDEEAKSIFEKSIKEAELASSKTTERQPLAFKEFKPYEEEVKEDYAGDIRKMLQTTDGGKRAVILSEILTRKY